MNSLRFIVALLGLFFCVADLASKTDSSKAEWTVLVYVQARNNLSPFSIKNFNDMMSVGSNQNLNLLVQWYKQDDPGVWRYKVQKGKLDFDEYLAAPHEGSSAVELVDAMSWAVRKYPAKKYCLILWNHGTGVLDPVWGESGIHINQMYFSENPRIQLDGVTALADTMVTDMQKEFDLLVEEMFLQKAHRGILFDEPSRTYLTNQALAEALRMIKEQVLNGENINILGMDACLMGMLEIAYQIKDCVDYFVSSQEAELAYGWNYLSWLKQLSEKTAASPAEVAQWIVNAYESLYRNKISFYTQSAVDLSKITQLKGAVDAIAVNMLTCYAVDQEGFSLVVKRARNLCTQFSSSSYIDLHSFLSELIVELVYAYKLTSSDQDMTDDKSCAARILKTSLEEGLKQIEGVVFANVFGREFVDIRGVSIYFPRRIIDESYKKTEFALDGAWIDLLQHAVLAKYQQKRFFGTREIVIV